MKSRKNANGKADDIEDRVSNSDAATAMFATPAKSSALYQNGCPVHHRSNVAGSDLPLQSLPPLRIDPVIKRTIPTQLDPLLRSHVEPFASKNAPRVFREPVDLIPGPSPDINSYHGRQAQLPWSDNSDSSSESCSTTPLPSPRPNADSPQSSPGLFFGGGGPPKLTGPVVAIQNGKLHRDSQAYKQFEEDASYWWSEVDRLFGLLEQLMQDYTVYYAEILCNAVLKLACRPIVRPYHQSELFSCVANAAEVCAVMSLPGRRYQGADGRDLAVRRIQATFRMSLARKVYLHHLSRVAASITLAKIWKARQMRVAIRKGIEAQYYNVHLKRFHRFQSMLKRDWVSISGHKRTVIQLVPSKLLGDIGSVGSDISIGRAFPLLDADVDIIFVTPYIDEDRIEYFKSILDSGFPEQNPLDANRIRFVVPEAARCFRPSTPISAMLLSSRRALTTLRRMCQQSTSFLICDAVGQNEVILSSTLGLPIFGPTPEAYSSLLSSQARARDFLRSTGVPLVPAMESHARDEYEVCLHTLKAVAMFPEVAMWTYLLDPSFRVFDENRSSEGPEAVVDPSALVYSTIMKGTSNAALYVSSSRPTSTIPTEKGIVADAYLRPVTAPVPWPMRPVYSARRERMAQYLPMAREDVSTNLTILRPGEAKPDFIKNWICNGGLIMGFPMSSPEQVRGIEVTVIVDFEGKFQLRVLVESNLNPATLAPCIVCVPHSTLVTLREELKPFLAKIAAQAAANGIFGVVTVQFLTWLDNATKQRRYWATGIVPRLTPGVLRGATVLLATGQRLDVDSWSMNCPSIASTIRLRFAKTIRYADQTRLKALVPHQPPASAGEMRVAYYVSFLEHGQVAAVSRAGIIASIIRKGIDFNPWTRTGVLFPKRDARNSACFPFICVDFNTVACLKRTMLTLIRIIHLLEQYAQETSASYSTNAMTLCRVLLNEMESIQRTSDGGSPLSPERRVDRQQVTAIINATDETTTEEKPGVFEEESGSEDEDDNDGSSVFLHESRNQQFHLKDLIALASRAIDIPADCDIVDRRPSSRSASRKSAKRKRQAFSRVTAVLLSEGIASEIAAKYDANFSCPILSPPFSRRSSLLVHEQAGEKAIRVKAYVEKMERQMEEQWERDSARRERTRSRAARFSVISDQHTADSHPQILEEDENEGDGVGSGQRGPPPDQQETISDMDMVLMRLKDLAERGERITAAMDERTKVAQEKLQEVNQHKQTVVEKRKSERRSSTFSLSGLGRSATGSLQPIVNDSVLIAEETSNAALPPEKSEPGKRIANRRISDLVSNILGDMIVRDRETSKDEKISRSRRISIDSHSSAPRRRSSSDRR
ncbi:hypothetical protein HDU85_006321 [Gaertneriomyces sp. JEL0708]|nr:hypothetical protein HDU85_006321 [Gaertneriomyces sp. JEL0708]